jgi:hypothetical protein
MSIKNTGIDWSDMSGGKNSAFPRHAVAKNQVCDTLNLIHEKMGVSRAPGFRGITNVVAHSAVSNGVFTFIADDGVQTGIEVHGSKVYTVNTTSGALTEIYTLAGANECYGVNLGGKFWLVNGTDFIKIEKSGATISAYRVQIAAPASGTAAIAAGGSLPVGVYGVYIAYVRKNSDGYYLYSLPHSLGDVTAAAGNLTIALSSLPVSSDPQVTHKVIFVTEAGGTVYYYAGEVANATTTATVAASATINKLIFMNTVSAANQILPITPDGIQAFDDKLIVWDYATRTVYWSLKTDINPFELERFLPANFRTLSKPIHAVFAIGEDLCFNHNGHGISKAISGDMTSIIKFVVAGLWFIDAKTPQGRSNVDFYKGIAWGFTNNGFRYFDGTNISDDLGFHIKPDVNAVYQGVSSTFIPSAIVNVRAGKRTEFRFSYRNLSNGQLMNNTQLVFNLDFFTDPNYGIKTWELWENGFTGSTLIDGKLYVTQSVSGTGTQICTELGVSDLNCFDYTGTFVTTKKLKTVYILSRTEIDDLDAIAIFGRIDLLATWSGTLSGNMILFDRNNSKYPFAFVNTPSGTGILPSESSGLGLELPFIMAPLYPQAITQNMPFDARGNSLAIEFSQTEDDPDFFLYRIQNLRAKQIKHNMS